MARTEVLYHQAKYGGDRALRAGCRRKSVICLFVFLFVTLSNYEVCDNENAIKQCNFQNNQKSICITSEAMQYRQAP